jgi:hypothetical protein
MRQRYVDLMHLNKKLKLQTKQYYSKIQDIIPSEQSQQAKGCFGTAINSTHNKPLKEMDLINFQILAQQYASDIPYFDASKCCLR